MRRGWPECSGSCICVPRRRRSERMPQPHRTRARHYPRAASASDVLHSGTAATGYQTSDALPEDLIGRDDNHPVVVNGVSRQSKRLVAVLSRSDGDCHSIEGGACPGSFGQDQLAGNGRRGSLGSFQIYSAVTRPPYRASAPTLSSAANIRAGSTGPGNTIWPGAVRLKPNRP